MMKEYRRIVFSALLLLALLAAGLAGCGTAAPAAESPSEATEAVRTRTGSMELKYARQFSVDYFSDGSTLLTIAGADRFLLLPEGGEAPAGLEDTTVVLRPPLDRIYVAASSAMDLFLHLNALDRVGFTSTSYEDWGLGEVREAMDALDLAYAGKYSAPDFELLLSEGCSLAVESTMIYHSPDIMEKLQSLGIPVLVERSSYEPHPLGRVEWIRLYGLLLGRETEAEAFFRQQEEKLAALDTAPAAGQTVAFFHISSAGAAVVRKPGDYVSRMIELAGGSYVFDSLPGAEDSALSTMNMQLEAFYAGARDADVLIYNSTIDGELNSLDALLQKCSLLADFKAVERGNVWCTEHDMFQKSSAAAGMIADFNTVLSQGAAAPDQLEFLHRLK